MLDFSIPTIFAHIPKAAGSSFGALIEEAFSIEEICPHQTVDAWSVQLWRDPGRYKLYRGHNALALRSILGKVNVITFVRDPIERSISHYHQIKRDPTHVHHEYVSRVTFSEFVRSEIGRSELLNTQCRQLAVESLAEQDLCASTHTTDPQSLNQFFADWQSATLLEKAMKTVGRCAIVAAIEDTSICYELLHHQLGLPKQMTLEVAYNATSNAEKRSFELPSADLDIVKAMTFLDQKLYDYARLIGMKSAEKIPETRLVESGSRVPAISVAEPVYDFAERLNGNGWHPRERSESGGHARWSSRQHSDIFLRLQRKRAVRVHFAARSYHPQLIDGLIVYVDNQEVELRRRRIPGGDGNLTFIEAVIPPAASDSNDPERVTRIEFEIPFLVCPNIHTNGIDADVRNLGIYLEGIRFSFANA